MRNRQFPEYHMVVAGTMPEPSEERMREIRAVSTNFGHIKHYAIEKVYEAVRFNEHNPRPKDWESSWEYIERKLKIRWPEGSRHWDAERRRRFLERVHVAAIALVLDLAKMSFRYWGIDDPSEQGYCSYCKRPRDIGLFNESRFTCDSCFRSRGGDHE